MSEEQARQKRMKEAMENAPEEPVENSEERFDNEVMPLIEQAHLKAVSLGLPIYTHTMISDQWVTSTVAAAPGGLVSMPITSIAAFLIAEGKHPRAKDMLLAAVGASKDKQLAGLMVKSIARAMEGQEGGEIFAKAGEVIDRLVAGEHVEDDLLDSLLSD